MWLWMVEERKEGRKDFIDKKNRERDRNGEKGKEGRKDVIDKNNK